MIQDQPLPSFWVLAPSFQSQPPIFTSFSLISCLDRCPYSWDLGHQVFFHDDIFRFNQFLQRSRNHRQGILQIDPFLLTRPITSKTFLYESFRVHGCGQVVKGMFSMHRDLCLVPSPQLQVLETTHRHVAYLPNTWLVINLLGNLWLSLNNFSSEEMIL